jgi:Na+/H+-dicarboxylate symporter
MKHPTLTIFVAIFVAVFAGIAVGLMFRPGPGPDIELDVYVAVCEDGYSKLVNIPYVAPKRDVRIEEELCKIYMEKNQ